MQTRAMGADRNTMKTKFKGGLGWGEAEKRFCVLANSVRENGLWATPGFSSWLSHFLVGSLCAQVPHLQTRENCGSHLIRLIKGLSELIYGKCLNHCIAHETFLVCFLFIKKCHFLTKG